VGSGTEALTMPTKRQKSSTRQGQRMKEALARSKRLHDAMKGKKLIPDVILKSLQANLPNDREAYNARLRELETEFVAGV
jgi:hypothetical protein